MPLGTTSLWKMYALQLALFHMCSASVTIYRIPGWQLPLTSTSSSKGNTNYTGLPAFNPTQLHPPPPPEEDDLPTEFSIELSNAVPRGASIEQSGTFAGFSVEMSVVTQACMSFFFFRLAFCLIQELSYSWDKLVSVA